MLSGALKMKEVSCSELTRNRMYLIVHHLKFENIMEWKCEYKGTFHRYTHNEGTCFNILKSFCTYKQEVDPTHGFRTWPKIANIHIYEMVLQGQSSMETRAVHKVLTAVVDESFADEVVKI